MIKGYCVGGGCELTLAADIRIAADNARLGIPAARLGIVIGYQEMRRLVDLIGPGNASYMLLSARMLDAHEARSMGLVNAVLPLDEIDGYVARLAQEVAELAPLSHRVHKQILHKVMRDSDKPLNSYETALPYVNFDSEDFQEGRRAFIERRKPNFKGR